MRRPWVTTHGIAPTGERGPGEGRLRAVAKAGDRAAITGSARSRSDGGIVRPRTVAVLRAMLGSTRVACRDYS
jgi:hypothetical protein